MVGWDLHVDHVCRDESDLGMARGVQRPEDHRCLAAGRRIRVVRVDQHEVEQVRPDMLPDDAQVIVHPEAFGLAGLCGEVADVELQRRRGFDRLHHSFDQQVGEDGRVQRTGPDDDQLGAQDRLRRFGVDLHAVRLEEHVADR